MSEENWAPLSLHCRPLRFGNKEGDRLPHQTKNGVSARGCDSVCIEICRPYQASLLTWSMMLDLMFEALFL